MDFNLFNGVIYANLGGAAALAVQGGAGQSVALYGNNNQTGDTIVSSGELDLKGACVLASSTVTVAGGTIQTDAGTVIQGGIVYYSTSTVASTINGQVQDGAGTGGLTLYAGRLIVTSPNGLADGSDLSVGANVELAFALPMNGQGLDSNLSTATEDAFGSDSDSTPVTDNGLNQFHEVLAAGMAVLNALMPLRYPISSSLSELSPSEVLQLCGDYISMTVGAYAANGNTWDGLQESTVDAAIVQVLQNMGKTASTNQNTWTPTFNNPWENIGITRANYILKFLATHDIS